MLQSVLAQPTGVPGIDVIGRYNCRFDGTSHPISGVFGSLAAAQAAFPNAGITSGTYSTDELDNVALIQAVYDAANGSGGKLYLRPNARGILRRTVSLIDAAKVSIVGGPGVAFLLGGMGTSPGIQITSPGGYSERMIARPLEDIRFYAWNDYGIVLPTGTAAGTVIAGSSGTGGGNGSSTNAYRTGSIAIECDSLFDFILKGIRTNGFDQPISWGAGSWSAIIDECAFTNGNIGAAWPIINGTWETGERIAYNNCDLDNNNYGFQLVFTDQNTPANSTATTMWIKGCSIDYNVKQGSLIGASSGNTNSIAHLHLQDNHIETNSATSGTAPPIYCNGSMTVDGNVFAWPTGTLPTALIALGPQHMATADDNKLAFDAGNVPIFSTAANDAFVTGKGNLAYNGSSPPLVRNASGVIMQAGGPGTGLSYITADYGTPLNYQFRSMLMMVGTSPISITVTPASSAPHAFGTILGPFVATDGGVMTFVAGAGVTLTASPTTKGLTFGGSGKAGARAWLINKGPDSWLATGDLN